jgi:hypothetical protein
VLYRVHHAGALVEVSRCRVVEMSRCRDVEISIFFVCVVFVNERVRVGKSRAYFHLISMFNITKSRLSVCESLYVCVMNHVVMCATSVVALDVFVARMSTQLKYVWFLKNFL